MPAKSHGESKTMLYRRWLDMKRACYSPNAKSYKTIGQLGIQVAPESVSYTHLTLPTIYSV